MVTPQLRESLREQSREGLRHGQANPCALRFDGRARRRHRALHVQDERSDPLAQWRQRQAIGSAQHQWRTECALQCRQATADGGVLDTHRTSGACQRFRLRRTQEVAQIVPVEVVNGSHARLYGSQNRQPEHFLCKPGAIPYLFVMTPEPLPGCSRWRGNRKIRFPHHSSTGGSRS